MPSHRFAVERESIMEQKIDALFAGWESPMVRACLQGTMGHLETWGENSAMASIGDFCFLAGRPVPELVAGTDAPILVPCGGDWAELIERELGEGAAPFNRYATRHTPESFDHGKLFHFIKAVPQGFVVRPIDKELYFTLMKREWSRDLCGCFGDVADFLEQGLGFVVTMGGNLPVAGASSYAVCDGAIEIEIDTHPDFRRRGLASACGARLILECLARGIYPGWDAHNEQSLSLAKRLGYQPDRPYTAYWVEDKVRYGGQAGIN